MKDKSIKADGDMTFTVTETNARKIKALSMYVRMLDDVAQECAEAERADPPGLLNLDGLLNALLDDATDRRIAAITKRHGFDGACECVDLLGACRDGAEVRHIVQEAEKIYYKRAHAEILAQIPVDDGQGVLPFVREVTR